MQAPEYPFPFAIDEMYDAYSLLHETKGKCIGMNTSGDKDLEVVLTGDSACVGRPLLAAGRALSLETLSRSVRPSSQY